MVDRKIIERTPWPKYPRDSYRSMATGEWGFLYLYDDGTFEFLDFPEENVPSLEERTARWSYAFNRGKQNF